MKKVVYVITDSGTGGSEQVLTQVLNRIDRDKFNPVGVVVLKGKREMATLWEKSGVPVFSLGVSKFPLPWHLAGLISILRDLHPDIVHAFLFHSVFLSRLAAIINRSFKLVTSPRVNYRFAPAFARRVDTLFNGSDDAILCESHSTRDYLIQEMGYSPLKTAVVQNGVDSEKYHYSESGRQEIRKLYGISDDEFLIGGVGRLHHQKGFDDLITGLSELLSRDKKIKLMITGEGPEEISLKKLARSKNISVIFPGKLSDMKKVFSSFDVFVQSSRYEGMSNALLEAMAVGLPIVATAVDGTKDVARQNENCLLIEPNHPEQLGNAVNRVFSDAGLRKKLSENAKKTSEEFSISKTIKGFERLYTTLFENV